jgi:hypothetical protein
MTRQRNSTATRRAIYKDHGGEARFWLAWVQGEIDGAVQAWFRTRALHDPALREDLDSVDAPSIRDDVRRALEATNYLVAAPAAANRPSVVEDLDDVTDLVLQGRRAEPPAPTGRQRLAPQAVAVPARSAARLRGTPPADPFEQPRRVLRQAIDQLTDGERRLLFAQWQGRDACRESLLRVLLPEDDQPPTRGEISDQAARLRRAEARLGQALGDRRELLRQIGPKPLWQILSEDYTGAVTNGRGSAPPLPPASGSRRKRRGAEADAEVYRRIAASLFKLLAAVDIPLPARDESGEATRLLQHLVGRESLTHFRELACWLHDTRARLALASHPSFYPARDRLLTWLAPECFRADRPRSELSFRLYLRARLKDYCRRKGWRPDGARDLDAAFRELDRDRIGDIVREAVEEAARAEEQPPALVGLPLAQALQWLQAAP